MKNTFEPFKNKRVSKHYKHLSFFNSNLPILCKNCKKPFGSHYGNLCPEEKGFSTQIT